LLAVVGAARVRFDALKERPGLVGAPLDFLEASEQFEALKHGDSTGVEMKPSEGDLVVRCNGFKKGSQARLSEGDCSLPPSGLDVSAPRARLQSVGALL
jgi:hypothetical protein